MGATANPKPAARPFGADPCKETTELSPRSLMSMINPNPESVEPLQGSWFHGVTENPGCASRPWAVESNAFGVGILCKSFIYNDLHKNATSFFQNRLSRNHRKSEVHPQLLIPAGRIERAV